jgi:serine/threonine protein kinase/Tfp pilus assembly protein PilF
LNPIAPSQWKEIDRIFAGALECDPSDRNLFLDKECAGNDLLRKEVESLLAHDRPETLVGGSGVEEASRLLRKGDSQAAAGDKIGSYVIVRSLGTGGMGEVYLAKDKLGRMVALKLLNRRFQEDQSGIARFQQEAQSLLALNHPNIVTVYDIGREDSVYYIASELVEGETVRQLLEGSDFELSDILDIAMQIATALAAAHEKGIVHRDIKPENVMIRRDGYIKVLDFGIAKLSGEALTTDSDALTVRKVNTAQGTVVGTASYMSPEQARGLNIDARTDLWSLGVMLYEAVAGRKPFSGNTTQDVLAAVLEKEPPPLARYANDLPEGLEWIVSRALRKDKEARYQTANELLLDLKELKKRIDVSRSISVNTNSGPTKSVAGSATTESVVLSPSSTSTSSAEYIVAEIKRHRLAFVVGILIVLAGIVALTFYIRGQNSAGPIQSIAVLPFENQNQDPDTDYLSDGLTENIINNLTQLPSLRVIPRGSVFHYKGKQMDSIAAGNELGVRAVLTGRMMQRGDTLIVSAELVDVRDNKQLWGEQYTRRVSDALALEQEISRQISEKLRLRLTGEEQKQLNKGGTNDPEAYQFYTKGRYYWNKRGSSGSLGKAIDQFQKAVDSDPNYALAYVGLADSYGLLEEYTGFQGVGSLQKAKAAAERALQIDDSLAEAHTALALSYAGLWLWDDAEREFRLSISLNPNYPTAHQWFGEFYLWMGRYEEGVSELKRAQQLDPLSLVINMWLAETYLRKGDTEKAIEEANKVLELDHDFPRPHQLLGTAFLKQGRYDEAIAELQKSVELAGRSSVALRSLGSYYGVLGKRPEAMAIIKELEQKYENHETPARDIAAVYSALGDKDQAFSWLEKDFKARSASLQVITYSSSFDPLRSDPRYTDLLRRMGLRL